MKKVKIFDDLMEGFTEAIKYRRGDKKAKLMVSRFIVAADPLKPVEIRRIRKRLRISQPMFAKYLGASLGTIRSWEQGVRKPNSTALRLLSIAKERPAALLKQISFPRQAKRR